MPDFDLPLLAAVLVGLAVMAVAHLFFRPELPWMRGHGLRQPKNYVVGMSVYLGTLLMLETARYFLGIWPDAPWQLWMDAIVLAAADGTLVALFYSLADPTEGEEARRKVANIESRVQEVMRANKP